MVQRDRTPEFEGIGRASKILDHIFCHGCHSPVALPIAAGASRPRSDEVTEKLRLLREFQAAWKRARFGLGASLPYEYDWAYAGNVLHREFEFKALSTGGKDGIETRSWTLDPGFLDFFLLETALDPAQNLAVFLGMNKSNLL